MERRRLGNSPITVTDICMGTMTFGTQCDEQLSFRIMDRAFDAGIDFFDAAELYPVPPSKELFGVTEEIVGRWLRTKPREAVIIATKVTGPLMAGSFPLSGTAKQLSIESRSLEPLTTACGDCRQTILISTRPIGRTMVLGTKTSWASLRSLSGREASRNRLQQ